MKVITLDKAEQALVKALRDSYTHKTAVVDRSGFVLQSEDPALPHAASFGPCQASHQGVAYRQLEAGMRSIMTHEIGDVVAWDKVPRGALVQIIGDADHPRTPAATRSRHAAWRELGGARRSGRRGQCLQSLST